MAFPRFVLKIQSCQCFVCAVQKQSLMRMTPNGTLFLGGSGQEIIRQVTAIVPELSIVLGRYDALFQINRGTEMKSVAPDNVFFILLLPHFRCDDVVKVVNDEDFG